MLDTMSAVAKMCHCRLGRRRAPCTFLQQKFMHIIFSPRHRHYCQTQQGHNNCESPQRRRPSLCHATLPSLLGTTELNWRSHGGPVGADCRVMCEMKAAMRDLQLRECVTSNMRRTCPINGLTYRSVQSVRPFLDGGSWQRDPEVF